MIHQSFSSTSSSALYYYETIFRIVHASEALMLEMAVTRYVFIVYTVRTYMMARMQHMIYYLGTVYMHH